jgi:hypothetical protein
LTTAKDEDHACGLHDAARSLAPIDAEAIASSTV